MDPTTIRAAAHASSARLWIAVIAAISGLLVGCQRTPQLGGNEECLGAADGLWTAVTAQDKGFVNSSEKVIEQLHVAGTMPDDAYQVLSSVIASTRAGDWETARADLKQFARGQRPAAAP